jgi:hypothetical protein
VGPIQGSEFRLSRKNDLVALVQSLRSASSAKVFTAYKRKDQKVKPSDTCVSDGSKPGGDATWKEDVIKKEKYSKDPTDQFAEFLIPKFSGLAKGARLKPERIQRMQVGDGLLEREKELLLEMLFNREAALSWDFTEKGSVRPEVTPPMEIRTVPHEAWQVPGFQVPKALTGIVAEMVRDRIKGGVLEPCYGPYRNPWFLVKKKEKGKYRLINAALEMNRVTIRDANLPPAVDEFSEEFAGCAIASLVDLFSGYDQLPLAEKCRDMTAFMTPLGLVRMTTIPMGATNSVAQFVRVVNKIIADHVPHHALPFVDDIGVKGPKTTYNNEFILPGVRRYVMEHIQWLDGVLADIERAGCTISGEKSQFCCEGLRVVGFVCDVEGRHPDTAKVIKILDWPPCQDAAGARGFIGICVFYRVFIAGFALIAQPIYALLKKNVPFVWGPAQQEAMDTLKIALTNPPALTSIDYENDVVILAVDASLEGWGGVLMVLRNGKRHPVRYESGIWSDAEKKYDATKRECRGVLKALKKVRFYLYGVKFILETDARVLVDQLNRSGTDLPGALVTRWLAWIRLFDFEVRHVPGTKHTAADGLSRKPPSPNDLKEAAEEEDIDDWVDTQLGCVRVFPVSVAEEEQPSILAPGYSEKSQKIAAYLSTLRKPPEMSLKEFNKFKKEALRFKLQGDQLFRRNSKNVPMRRVVDDPEERQRILEQLHDESGHRGREGTYRRIADRYWWDDLYGDAQKYVKTCPQCQMRDPTREEEALHPTWVTLLWEKVGVDIVHMPPDKGKHYLVVARDDFSGWAEARALPEARAWRVAKFLWEDVICRHGCFGKLTVDGGPENKGILDELVQRYRIKKVITSSYHPQANGMIERGHRPLSDALSKMSDGGLGSWVDNLHAVLWADRSTVKSTTGLTPFYLQCGSEPVLPIELEIPTWRILPWQEVHTTEDLLAMRARQLQRRDEDMDEARDLLERMRKQGKEYFDSEHSVADKEINKDDLVLLHDTQHENDRSTNRKLKYRWRGPFRVKEVNQDKGTYLLQELDGTDLAGTFAGNRIKKFHQRQSLETSPPAPPDPAMDGHEPIEEDDAMEEVFDPQSLVPEGWPLAVVVP